MTTKQSNLQDQYEFNVLPKDIDIGLHRIAITVGVDPRELNGGIAIFS